jgi:hypothetical protein
MNRFVKIAGVGTPTIATGRRALPREIKTLIKGTSNIQRTPFKNVDAPAGAFGGSYNGTVNVPKSIKPTPARKEKNMLKKIAAFAAMRAGSLATSIVNPHTDRFAEEGLRKMFNIKNIKRQFLRDFNPGKWEQAKRVQAQAAANINRYSPGKNAAPGAYLQHGEINPSSYFNKGAPYEQKGIELALRQKAIAKAGITAGPVNPAATAQHAVQPAVARSTGSFMGQHGTFGNTRHISFNRGTFNASNITNRPTFQKVSKYIQSLTEGSMESNMSKAAGHFPASIPHEIDPNLVKRIQSMVGGSGKAVAPVARASEQASIPFPAANKRKPLFSGIRNMFQGKSVAPAQGSAQRSAGVYATPESSQARGQVFQQQLGSIKHAAFMDELQQMGMPEEMIEKVAAACYDLETEKSAEFKHPGIDESRIMSRKETESEMKKLPKKDIEAFFRIAKKLNFGIMAKTND